MAHEHDLKIIRRCVTMLKGKKRELLFLKMKGYRNTEIAGLTGTSIAGVKNTLSLARRSVSKKLNNIYFGNNLITKPEIMNSLPAVKTNTAVARVQQPEIQQTPIRQGAPLPEKITISLTGDEWRMLTTCVLGESENAWKIQDKYMKALLYPLLRAVYIKLHNKLHSLKVSKNTLNLSLPEASVLASALLELNSDNYLIVTITGYIDQKLT
jgi:DNA-binding CsgD family transcriptional regulator